MKKNAQAIIFLTATMLVSGVYADVFGTSPNQFTMEFVDIENAANPADNTGHGSVSYNYRIGKFEVTVAQFAAAFAADGSISDGFNSLDGADKPVSEVSFYEAAKFCNWLTSGNANNGAYQLNGSGQVIGIDRASAISAYGLSYVLPTQDEWYKAAHYKPDATYGDYRTYTWTAPTAIASGNANYKNDVGDTWDVGSGLIEQNGTFDMTGNVREWTETFYVPGSTNVTDKRVARGGAYLSFNNDLKADFSDFGAQSDAESTATGFRVVAIPEPGTMSLMGISTCALFVTRRVRRRKLAGATLMPIRRRPNACDVFNARADEFDFADEDLTDNTYLSVMMDHMIDWSVSAWSWTYNNYKSFDVMFWNKMVESHEKRVIRSKARRANLKKKTLACFDAFLALIMK